MTVAKFNSMNLNELRQYVLTHREDIEAFHTYIDRSKSEGQMINLDLNNDQWEEKVKEAIKYSSKAIRWYCNSTVEDNSKIFTIIQWWKKLNQKTVIKQHFTGIEVDRETGIWEPTLVSPSVQVMITEPSLDIGESTALIKYKDKNGSINQIEAVAIDLDIDQQNLFVWLTKSNEVLIFSLK